MDVTTSAVAMSQYRLQSDLAMGVLKKTLDLTAEQGAEVVKLMAQSSGVGGRMDLYA